MTKRSSKEYSIDSKTARNRLKPRREPYWHKLQTGGYVGYRRAEDGGTWIARYRIQTDDGRYKQQYESLGVLNDFDAGEQYDEAQDQAQKWFKSLGSASVAGYTVKDTIDDYVKHREIKNNKDSAEDARQRLYKHVVPTLGHIRLTKLTKRQMSSWKNSLVRVSGDAEDKRKSQDGANRLLSYFKAALNVALENDIIGTDKAWRKVKAFKDVGAVRKVFLTEEQVTRLKEKTSGGFRDLVISGLLTGARYGEIAAAKVADFDAKEGTIFLDGKTGPRDCYLSDESVAHFKLLTKGKLPGAYLHVKDDGTSWGKSHQSNPMKEAVRAAKLPAGTTYYTLRHVHISRALLGGINAQVLAENTGTSVLMIEKHYAKFIKSDRRAMFNQIKFA